MSGIFIFGVIFLAVVAMVISISKFNQHPFLVLTVVAIVVGLVCGIPTEEVINTVKSGFGNILASIGIVILAGTIIGTILEKTGAALTMANSILKLVGKKNSVLTMGLTGYVTGIPVFCDSGFVILSPVSYTHLDVYKRQAFLRLTDETSAVRILKDLKMDNDTISKTGTRVRWWNRPIPADKADIRRSMSQMTPELYDLSRIHI